MKKDSLFKGTFILSISLILTKFIGLIYIIPYYKIIGGEENMSLFNYSYNYYVILLEVSSAGIPLTIAKLVSKYNSDGNYEKSREVYKAGSTILLISGILGFLFFFFGAEFLSIKTIGTKNITRYSVNDLTLVIRSLSLALPFVMISSGLRGLFQGHEVMVPSAVSQFIEQLVRIIFMLFGTYFVIYITSGNIVYANAMATFSTVVGSVFSVIILIYYLKKYYGSLDINKNINLVRRKKRRLINFSIIREILLVSIPFVLVSSFFTVLTVIDQNTIIETMFNLGEIIGEGKEYALQAEKDFTVYSGLINKIVMIAVSLAPAFTGAFLPAITRLYTVNDIIEVKKHINKVLLALLTLVLPALIGMFALAEPIYNSFYAPYENAYGYMRVYLFLALLYSIYGVLGVVMQAIDKQKINILIIFAGFGFKFIFNSIFIQKFETVGALYCSILTYVLMLLLSTVVIYFSVGLYLREFFINFLKIIVSSLVMIIWVLAVYDAIILNFDISLKIDSVTIIIISAIFGVPIYFTILNKLKFFRYLFNKDFSLKMLLRR